MFLNNINPYFSRLRAPVFRVTSRIYFYSSVLKVQKFNKGDLKK